MHQRTYLTLYSIGTILSWLGWAHMMRVQTPVSARVIDFFLLYGLLFLAVFGTMAIMGTLIRFRSQERLRNLETTVRQAFFYAVFVVGLLFLQSFRLVRWWNLFLLLCILTLVEFFFLVSRRSPSSDKKASE